MNQGMFKLVYSKVLNMYVPASEAVRSRGSKSAKRRVRKHANAAVFTLMVSFLHQGSVWADSPAGLVPGSQAWVNATITGATSNSLTIKQTAPRAILDWTKLNLNKGELLQFNQQGNRNWSALNRIRDLSPSFIDGIVKADGNVYFINTNGIIFGQNAQFNVGSIYAGTLDIADDLFNEGLLSKPFKPVFEGVGGFIRVEKGAEINTAIGGKVVLFAENVENSGVINTPDGQTILAAGKKVYLQDSKDPAGFLVEVDGGGTATNLGKIVAERGNITLMGLAVNQSGTLTATTSVRANGSIRLLAQDSAAEIAGGVIGARNGLVTLAKSSVTEVKPEYDNKEETIVSQAFNTSKVEIEASLINIDGKISVKGGNVLATTAKTTNVASVLLNSQNPTRIFLGENAEIDVSGVNAIAPMSRNQLEVELFSDQLRDAPILRDGGLFKETVYVDARKGTDLFDIKPFLALKGATVSERMTKAGTVTLSTPNDLIVSKGAVINVSGGSTTYEAGTIKETNLFYNGKLVPISEAKPGVPYDTTGDLYFQKSDKWGVTRVWNLGGNDTRDWGDFSDSSSSRDLRTFIVGNYINSYKEGDDAGKVDLTVADENVLTQNLLLAGILLANTTVGTQQYVQQALPKNGELLASARDLAIEANAKNLPSNFSFEDALPSSANYQSVISTDLLAQGFNKINLTKVEKLVVNQTIALKPKGELKLNQNLASSQTNINANIFAPSSNVILSGNTTVANGVTISTAGLFTNDTPGAISALSQPAAVDGGTITTNGGVLTIGDNVTLDASAGAWLNHAGELQKGKAGDISFTMVSQGANTTLQSYGFDKGGILSVGFNQSLNIAGNPNARTSDVDLSAEFFNLAGFSAYHLSTNGNLQIGDGSNQEIYATGSTWFISPNIKNLTSGSIASVAKPMLQPTETRAPVSLEFTASNIDGILTLAENTTLRTDRGGEVSLAAGRQVNVLGDIVTPSGTINIKINDKDGGLLYDPTQAIFIGSNANLSAIGSSLSLPDSQPSLLKAQVFNAGNITIDAPKGALIINESAVLDVSGTSIVNDTKTASGFTREALHGDAGTIKLSASDGLLLDGTFKGSATGTGRGGTLDIGFTSTRLDAGAPILTGNREFTITQQKQLVAENFAVGDTLKTATGNSYTEASTDVIRAGMSADQVNQGGFANLKVKSFVGDSSLGLKDSIQIENGLDLHLAGILKLETPQINVKNDGLAKLTATHITLKSPNSSVDNASIAAGEGKLTTQSKQLYIDGLMAIAGVKETSINTTQDISGQGTQIAKDGLPSIAGGLVANGNINLKARQIYPNTAAKLSFEAVGANSTISVLPSGIAVKPVLSAGGTLSLTAENVVQSGVLTAPFGQINIDATKSATFTAGSVTSVSANNQMIPYGITSTGGQVYNLAAGASTPLPEKTITIKSANVDLQKKAVLDLSAGGDMFAYEFVPGIGGSNDVLAQANTYAVIPNLGQDYAPFDQVYSDSSAPVSVGQSVFLTGVPGLATGNYTLLPARFALVPGAFLVEANVVGSKLLPAQVAPQLDGSTLTTGYRADLGTGARDANWSTFKVTDGAIFRPATGTVSKAPSQYVLTSANTFFANTNKTDGKKVVLPQDVGTLSIDSAKLALDGAVAANKVVGGAGLNVDISSTNIRVVNNQDLSDTSSLQLTASSINALNAESLLLGGSRKLRDGVVEVATGAETVSIENNSSNVIKTPEFIAAAKDKITVNTDAAIDTGAASKTPAKTVIKADGDGALLALSSNSDISYSRTGGSATSTKGELNIEAGSTVKAGNSVVLDATKSASLLSNVSLQDSGSATLGANRILIGDAPIGTLGLNVNSGALAALGQLKTLTLNSYNNIDTFGSVSFGNNKLDLTMNAAGIVGHLGAGEATAPTNATPSIVTAQTFTLKNTQNAQFTDATDPSGRGLEINAATVKLDGGETVSGKTQIAGFTKLDIKADEIRVANKGEASFNVAETKLTTGRLTADTAADYKINTNEKIEIAQLANAVASTNKGFGAKLDISAKDLTVASNIDLSSGKLAVTTTNDLNIAAGANLSAASTTNTFYDKTVTANAGSVTLTSTTGNVNVNTGALVDVTSQGEANAGLVKVLATNGTANIAGDLKGAAMGTGRGGVLDVDVKTLADLTATNNRAAGFDEGRQYRVRTGDVNISGTGANALKARETIVSVDAGKITVTGDIIATAPKNAHIGLFAGNGVTLENTANLKANSTKVGEEGGKVEVYTRAGSLDLKAGSNVEVSAGVGGTGGKVHLRAPRTGAGAGNGVAVTNLASNITGAKSTVLEAFKTFLGVTSVTTGSGTGATLGFNTVKNDVNSFMGNKDLITTSLGKAGDETFHLRAGTEIQSATSLTLGSDWNLYSTTSTVNEPSVLTLRAKDNITFNGSLSDGFTTATSAGLVGEGDSTSYKIVAGADFTAANILATNASSTSGNITINNGTATNTRVIRTGTGNIDMAAGGNLVMGGANTAIYTAGRTASTLDGFDLPSGTTNYLTDGGDINIAVKGNIAGGESQTNNRQLINQWLFRQGGGSADKDTSWWVRPDLFKQSLATMGGGDINIVAGSNISNFSVSAPTTARFDTNGTTGNQSIDGGGDVKVNAGGDIRNGVYFVAKGDGEIDAGGSVQKQGNTFGTILALQDGKFNVTAGKNTFIETTINPTLVSQSTTNATLIDRTGNNAYFNSYSPQAAVNVSSLLGNAEFGGKSTILGNIAGLDSQVTDSLKYAPSQLKVISHNGDVNIGVISLLPSPTGDLKVLAAKNIGLGNILMSDADPALLPSIDKPISKINGFSTAIANQLLTHSAQLLHKNNPEPVLIVAKVGNISPDGISKVTLPKVAKIVAGKDINGLVLDIQNNNSSDISLIKAGNDIKVGDVTVSGPGNLLLQAGRNIDLSSTSARIATTGSAGLIRNENTIQISNAALPSEGASITLQAGLGKGANVQGYINQYILPTGAGPTVIAGDATKLSQYRIVTTNALTDFMRENTGNAALSAADALALFNNASVETKTIFANRHLSSELLASAEAFAKSGSHDRGYQAIAKLFPTLNEGDIALYKSKITTNNGGSIDLLAPGGLINVGVAGGGADDVGVITEKGGAIRATANNGFEVNQSKVITQFGSDITVWSTTGTIDAGRGSKTATSIPERVVQTDVDGNTTIEVKGVAAGSGIRAQSYDPDGPSGKRKAPAKGRVSLIAPIVDAGEAGIEAGDLLIVAPIVLNATNIQVSGASSGVPIAATAGFAGAGVSTTPDAVNAATQAVAQSVAQSVNQSSLKPELPSLIYVDVISIGL